MNRILLSFIACLAVALMPLKFFSQTQQIIWTDTFINNLPASSTQTAAWTAFTASLVPQTYTKVTISGSFDPTGVSCTDTAVATALANALYTNTDYISPVSCSGYIWHNCATHGFLGQVWLNPPNACDGSNCPNGYIIRPAISQVYPGNVNWGGVNTLTCGAPSQRMTLIFEYGTVTSVNDAESPELGVNPNPFNSSVSILLSRADEAEMTVCNVLGDLVMAQKIYAGETVLSTKDWPAGVYFVTISTGETRIVKKIIKE
ncbi:MAG: T9SS type A sorting domain-containing protein [Bacteroidota bacterium]